jgi:hypothetical protein
VQGVRVVGIDRENLVVKLFRFPQASGLVMAERQGEQVGGGIPRSAGGRRCATLGRRSPLLPVRRDRGFSVSAHGEISGARVAACHKLGVHTLQRHNYSKVLPGGRRVSAYYLCLGLLLINNYAKLLIRQVRFSTRAARRV